MKKEDLWYRNRGFDRLEQRFNHNIAPFIKKRLRTEKEVRILEIGFGEGKCLLDLRHKFPQSNVKLFGINNVKKGNMHDQRDFLKNAKDFSIKIDNKNLPKPYFYDVGKGLKFKSNYFDLIISQVSIHYIGNKAKVIEECWRTLKLDGKAFLHIDRTPDKSLPWPLNNNNGTPYFIIYKGKKMISLKSYLQNFKKLGFYIKLVFTNDAGQAGITIIKNTSRKLNLKLNYDEFASFNLSKYKKSKKDRGIWWGTRSIFHIDKVDGLKNNKPFNKITKGIKSLEQIKTEQATTGNVFRIMGKNNKKYKISFYDSIDKAKRVSGSPSIIRQKQLRTKNSK